VIFHYPVKKKKKEGAKTTERESFPKYFETCKEVSLNIIFCSEDLGGPGIKKISAETDE